MKKLLIVALLLASSAVYATPQDDADEEAAEKVGMTLEGYRNSAAYKARKTKAAENSRCRERRAALDDKVADSNRAKDRIENRQADLAAVRSSLEFRFTALNSVTTNYGNLTVTMRAQFEQDQADYNARLATWKKDRDAHNRRARDLDDDIDTYNRECSK